MKLSTERGMVTMRSKSGFTLVEVMIVVAILAIVLAIALPSYEASIRKSKRTDAQKDLMDFAGFAERIYTQDNSYAAVTLPANTDYYTYSFPVAVTATSWTIRAAPIGDQANDKCGTMDLTNTGLRTYSGTEVGCWGREVSS